MKHLFRVMILALSVSLLSCSDDDEPVDLETGDIIITSRLTNPDGFTGSEYMQIINNIDAAQYDNKTAYPLEFGTLPFIIGSDVFTLPGMGKGTTNIFKKYSLINGQLILQNEYTLPTASGGVHCVTSGDEAYVSLLYQGKVLVINHQTMEFIDEIDISEYGVGDNNPDPAIMIIRDNLLFVGLNQWVAGYAPDSMRAKADVLIIDTETNEVVKMITESTSGFSMPTNLMVNEKSIFMDEKKDIYINCLSGYGFVGHKAGFLRIKAGETDFDKSYSFDVTQTNVEGDQFSPSFLIKVQYVGNGKLYATGITNERFSMPEPDNFEDKVVVCYEVDLQAKTLKRLDFPLSTGYGTGIGIYNQKILFGLITEQDAGFYTYDTQTGEASPSAVIKVVGDPWGFAHFGETY